MQRAFSKIFVFVWMLAIGLTSTALAGSREFTYTFPNGNRLHYQIVEGGRDRLIFADTQRRREMLLLEGQVLHFMTVDPAPGTREGRLEETLVPEAHRSILMLAREKQSVVVLRAGYDSRFFVRQDGMMVMGPEGAEESASKAQWRMQFERIGDTPYTLLIDANPRPNGYGVDLLHGYVVREERGVAETYQFSMRNQTLPDGPLKMEIVNGVLIVHGRGISEFLVDSMDWTFTGALPEAPTPLPATFRSRSTGLSIRAELGRENVGRFETWLRDRVIEQEEVLGILVASERRRAMEGPARLPEIVLYGMGQPGTGKDVTAMSFVDALWQREGAYHEHLFMAPQLKNFSEVWTMLGPSSGHVGSTVQTPFIRFLVEHSGGKYLLEREEGPGGKKGDEKVVMNPDWNGPGSVRDAVQPHMGVVFLNEFHDWDMKAKDAVLKEGFEYGRFHINNPNGGESVIEVPIRFVIASNEGTSLVSSRELDGTRYGQPLSYEESVEKWKEAAPKKQRLREEIWRTNSLATDKNPNGGNPGVSEALLSRVDSDRIALYKPLSPGGKQRIAGLRLGFLKQALAEGRGDYGPIRIDWSPGLVQYVQEFEDLSEENGRPLRGKVESIVQNTLYKMIWDRKVTPGGDTVLYLDVVRNADGTANLKVTPRVAGKAGASVSELIARSLSEKQPEELTDGEVRALFELEQNLQRDVVGNRPVLARVARRVVVSEEGRRTVREAHLATQPAQAYFFLGMSSTGKTETAKAIARWTRRPLKSFDFSQVRTVDDLKRMILGYKDSRGVVTPSDFMKEYDRSGGRFVANLDEIANAPKDVLKALYDLLREPVVTTFADGKPRVMSFVIVVSTGNAGEEWYEPIPRSIPEEERIAAMADVFERAIEDPDFIRATVERHFSPALVNRIGLNNIFFFGPLGVANIRELSSMKVAQAFERLKPVAGRRGWNLGFRDQAQLVSFLNVVDREAFVIDEQGASIDRFVKQDLEEAIRYLLLKQEIPSGTNIFVSAVPAVDSTATAKGKAAYLELHLEGRAQPLRLEFPFRERNLDLPASPERIRITAYHEAGHEITRHALLGDFYKPKRVTIIPGVDKLGDAWIRYLGMAQSVQVAQIADSRERLVREIAVLVGGGEAESWVTVGETSGAGKSNDLARANQIAEGMILRYGLSKKWGWQAVPDGMPLATYKASLPQDRVQLLSGEVAAIVGEARALARAVLRENEEAFLGLGRLLAERGDLSGEQIEAHYAQSKPIVTSHAGWGDRWAVSQVRANVSDWVGSLLGGRDPIEPHVRAELPEPASIINPDTIRRERAEQARSGANISRTLPLVSANLCEGALSPKRARK